MGDNSTNNEILLKTLSLASLPPKMSSTNLTLPKPICSTKYTPVPTFQVQQHTQKTTKDENCFKKQGYANLPHAERDTGMIALEHCYARPLNSKPDSSFYQPTKFLFMQEPTKKKSVRPLVLDRDMEDNIDVEFVPPPPTELYDKAKAIHLMEECDRHVETHKAYETDEHWEESIVKTNWSSVQFELYTGMADILNEDYLARSAIFGSHHEPIQRRILVDKSVQRVRRLFATILWDIRLTQWVHQLLLDHLSSPYLSAYIDILQTLKAKLPDLVDKIVFGSSLASRIGPTSSENMFEILKRPWDPFSSTLSQSKPRKLPGNPVIIIVPSAPSTSNIMQFKRQHKWMNHFANLSTVVAVHTNIGSNANRLTMINCADQMLTATRAKVQEVKADYSGRTIILVGFNAGAALALQVAQVESVFCVVCMGFSVLTAEGRCGDPDDNLLELQCPVLFVIGQISNTASQEDVEDLRERMRVENGLIVVGAADDYLRVNKKKKRAEGITQNYVDRTIVESVGEFISSLMLSPYPPQVRQSPTQVAADPPSSKRLKVERIRNNSNCSSLESEPPSPTPKITRPVGRPPGSKSKNRLEAKWAAQVAQGTLPSPSPPPSTQPTSKIQVSKSSSPSLLDSSLPLPSDSLNIKSLLSQNDNSDRESSIEIISDSSSDKVEPAAKLRMMMGLNRTILTSGNTASNIVTTPNKIPMMSTPKHSSGIKVLSNVSLNPPTNGRFVQGPKQGFDLSKIVINPMNASKNLANMLLMPEGKLKTTGLGIKGNSGTPYLLPISQKKPNVSQIPSVIRHGVAKYITSKKQLLERRPPHLSQKPSIITSYASNLPPPTNLTSQDIMDLPIIFADDNQMLTHNSELQQVSVSDIQPIQPLKLPQSNPVGRFVCVTKQQPLLPSLSMPTLKRPTFSVPVRTSMNPEKLTKIIISRGLTNEPKRTPVPTALTKVAHFSPEISIRRIEGTGVTSSSAPEPVDLENKLIATAIPKPEYSITIRKEHDYDIPMNKSIEVVKRNAIAAQLQNVEDDDDPDYVPPKSVKLK